MIDIEKSVARHVDGVFCVLRKSGQGNLVMYTNKFQVSFILLVVIRITR